jgi:hypothetical protein
MKMETIQGFAIDPNDPPTFEKVWKMFQETREQIATTDLQMKETGRRMQELSEETSQQIKETEKLIQELSKNVGGINNAFGKWAEEMVSANLWEKFYALGYDFTIGGPRKYVEGKQVIFQVDTLLENGDYAMAVEIKSELTAGDVDKHLERIGKIKAHLDKRGDRRKLVGAAAGMVVTKTVLAYAQEKGLYVLVQSGLNRPGDLSPVNGRPGTNSK